VQNLVAVVLVVLTIEKFEYFVHLAWKRLFTPTFGCFGGKNRGKWKVCTVIPLGMQELTSYEAKRIKNGFIV